MKLSISISTLLLVLPALVSASSIPVHVRGLNGDVYMPRNHARHNGGRGRQGGFSQGNSNKNKNQGGSATAQGTSTDTSATTSCPAPTTVTVTAGAAQATTTTSSSSSNNGGNQNKNKNGNTAASTSASTTDTSANATSTSTTDAAAATVASNNNTTNNSNDPQTSLTLLSNLVETGLENDGQQPPVAGQVASLTSSNNFINFCAGKTITNGAQVKTGSCNPIPMGDVVSRDKMPSSKFVSPTNQDVIPANVAFTVKMNINNMQAGVFTNAQKTYYMAPQQLNNQGILIGHSHFVIQKMNDFTDPTILDPGTFAFFKGINGAAVGGQLTADVPNGLPAGNYRLASINTDANHAPAIVAVAQHGWLDDIVYFTAQ